MACYSHRSKDFCLLFQHNSLMLLNVQNCASIMCLHAHTVDSDPGAWVVRIGITATGR